MKKINVKNAIKTLLQTAGAVGAGVVAANLAEMALDQEDLVESIVLGGAAIAAVSTGLTLAGMAIDGAQTIIEHEEETILVLTSEQKENAEEVETV